MSRSNVSSAYALVYAAWATSIFVSLSLAEDIPKKATQRGLVRHEHNVAPGYTLFSPFSSKSSFLIDADGNVVHQWESRYNPGLAPYLLPNGNLLRGIQVGVKSRFEGGGISGGLQEFSWDGKLLWEFHLASDLHYYHHDIEPLPNGNILMIIWESRTKQEVLDAGRRPDYASEKGLWPDAILEVEPLRPYGARVVWQWHVWDHLIQDTNPQLPNYGVVRDHPERLDVNVDVPRAADTQDDTKKTEEQQAAQRRQRERTDWLHFNGVDYNAEFDQIVISAHSLNEIWIIDHSTTTEEAAGSSGGRAGRGGDLLYRWGNPQNYQAGTAADQKLFHQHDPQWIPAGFPSAGNITIFNNGPDRPGGENYSTVVEIETPRQADGTYQRENDKPFLPSTPSWEYNPKKEERFFANFISGAHRLANGNTLICSGPDGRIFEVSPEGNVVWEYRNPFASPNNDKLDDRSYSLFRATRIPLDHLALRGKVLAPLNPQPKTAEMILAERPKPGDASPGWQPLDGPTGSSRWVHVHGEEASVFRTQPDTNDDSKSILQATGKSSGILRSDRMYENFILEFEWKLVEKQADAGLLIWTDALPAIGAPQPRGIEIEICDRGNSAQFTSHGDIVPSHGARISPDPQFRLAGDRSMPKESDFHVRPTGEWNHYRVTAVDGSVTLEVNGHLVSGGSRCTPSKGHLCLVSERGEVHFRNPRIWALPIGSHAADSGRSAQEATSHRSIYNRVNLDNWKVLSGDWKSDDWRITCAASPCEIEVELGVNVEHLFFDFKRQADSGSGRKLPFRIGDLTFGETDEVPGQWNRVHVDFADSEVKVTFGGTRQVATCNKQTASRLTLVNESVATEFCNVFVRSQ